MGEVSSAAVQFCLSELIGKFDFLTTEKKSKNCPVDPNTLGSLAL